MEQNKRIVFTGGGTAGHVTPNVALIRRLLDEGWDVHYIGTEGGMERGLIGRIEGVKYHCISAGKLRRYFSWQNFTDAFRVVKGLGQARRLVRELKPDVIFSKGGYVSLPVVMAAGKTPVVAHESDITPGLANRIAGRFANHICVSFEDTLKGLPQTKAVFTGAPIRTELYGGDKARARAMTGFSGQKPVLLAMGGSLGAQRPNELLREALPYLLPRYDIVHLCGKGKCQEDLCVDGYVQYEYIGEELPDLFALADVVLSRAGANAVFELLALKKPALLIPLSKSSTRGDQLRNAAYFENKGYALTMHQDGATAERLTALLDELYERREDFIRAMERETRADGTEGILALIRRVAGA